VTSCDTNILFAALEAMRPGHRKARAFLESHRDNREFALCELVLVELYLLARNPVICRKALGAPEAVAMIRQLSANPAWRLVDYPGPEHALSERLWRLAASPDFARRRISDARLALTLRHHGVTEFATSNVRDFEGFGFQRVWDPLSLDVA
jgi:toxin-antitoxin system PIN domain toxin